MTVHLYNYNILSIYLLSLTVKPEPV